MSSNKYRRITLKNGETLKLNERMYAFALELARSGSEKQAAKAAGYTDKGFLNRRKDILTKIEPLLFQLQQEAERLVVMDKARILEELSHVALANPLDYLHPDGKPKELHELTREQAAAVANFEVTESKKGERKTSYKLYNKLDAIQLGGKHFGMFDARLIIQGRMEHLHKHKHDVVDWTKVPTDRLEQIENLLQDEAKRQGVTLQGTVERND